MNTIVSSLFVLRSKSWKCNVKKSALSRLYSSAIWRQVILWMRHSHAYCNLSCLVISDAVKILITFLFLERHSLISLKTVLASFFLTAVLDLGGRWWENQASSPFTRLISHCVPSQLERLCRRNNQRWIINAITDRVVTDKAQVKTQISAWTISETQCGDKQIVRFQVVLATARGPRVRVWCCSLCP